MPNPITEVTKKELKASTDLMHSVAEFYFSRAKTDAMRRAIIAAHDSALDKLQKQLRKIAPDNECPEGFVGTRNGGCVRRG